MIEWTISINKVNIQPWIVMIKLDAHRVAERVSNRIDQDAILKDKFDLIEAKGRSANE